MLETDTGWRFDIERGPDWAFVRLHPPNDRQADHSALADEVWSLLQQSFTYRVVLELDQIKSLKQPLLIALTALASRVHDHEGLMRICGLSPEGQQVIRESGLEESLPHYGSRADAVMGHWPMLPR